MPSSEKSLGYCWNYGITAAFTSLFDPNLWPFRSYMFKDPVINIGAQYYMELSKLFILPSRGRYLAFSQQV